MSDGKISKNKKMRLSYKQKLQIVNLIGNGVQKKYVAQEFNICNETARKIVNEKGSTR